MKIRSMKLREAHKCKGVPSYCSILFDLRAERILTASSSEPSICIQDALVHSNPPKIIRNHRDGVTALTLSPNSTCLASGSIDHSVKLYKFPSGEFETNITRFTLPIRALSFNKSGTMLAAAGDDAGIKLINTIDGSIARVLKGHRGSITGLAFDPNSEYLASIDSVGTLIIWELHSGATIHTLKGVAPDTGSDFSTLSALNWSPDGEMLAVSGLRNDVVMYDRDTAEKLFSLRGDHVQPICFLSWSPNGKYMATSGLDRQVLIWDIGKKQDIDRQKFEEVISCMAWKPHGNALAVIDVMGKYGVWDSPVPSSMRSPTEDIPNLQSKIGNGLLFFDEEEQEPSTSGNLSDHGEDILGDSEPPSRKRSRKHSTFDDDSGEDDNKELDFRPKVESRKKPSHGCRESLNNGKEKQRNSVTVTGPKMQEAFQSGATPVQPGKRRFLCYNMLGSITTMEHDGYSHIEIDFHDTGRGPRVPAMTDYFGFTLASLNEKGGVFANPCKGEKNMSTLMYRPFSSWASNSEWSMRFEEEEVRAVALGTSWVAAVTSLNFLRIFTEGGLQVSCLVEGNATCKHSCSAILIEGMSDVCSYEKETLVTGSCNDLNAYAHVHQTAAMPLGTPIYRKTIIRDILSLDGPVVTASGFGDELVVVTHSSPSLPSNEQMLEFRVFNISNGTQPITGRLPLTPGSVLTWFGFSEEGQLSSFDSKGVLRVFTNHFGGSWLPLFSASKLKKPEENYWVAGLNASKLFCVVCKSPESFPQVTPKPVLTLLDFSFPLASSDLGAETLENEFIFNNMHLIQIQRRIEDMAAVGQDITLLDDEAFDTEASLDRCILRLIASCCNGDKLVRATELVKLLSLEKSVKGAIKIVTELKLPNLAERFNNILEERLLKETIGTKHPPSNNVNSDTSVKAEADGSQMLTLPGNEKTSEPVAVLQSSKLSFPSFVRKVKKEEPAKVEKKQAGILDNKGLVNNVGLQRKNVGEVKNEGEVKKVGDKANLRSSNPFAKSSNNQERSSVLDSLKKLKKSDGAK